MTKYVDGKTTLGFWANMCLSCHREVGVGIGPGRGQYYKYSFLKEAYIKLMG
ncbi:MAG: hypothetical protein QMD92_00185 [bacterium]|nr:hypothetical protein [bacterium]